MEKGNIKGCSKNSGTPPCRRANEQVKKVLKEIQKSKKNTTTTKLGKRKKK